MRIEGVSKWKCTSCGEKLTVRGLGEPAYCHCWLKRPPFRFVSYSLEKIKEEED